MALRLTVEHRRDDDPPRFHAEGIEWDGPPPNVLHVEGRTAYLSGTYASGNSDDFCYLWNRATLDLDARAAGPRVVAEVNDVMADLRWRFDIRPEDTALDAEAWASVAVRLRGLVLRAYTRNHEGAPEE